MKLINLFEMEQVHILRDREQIKQLIDTNLCLGMYDGQKICIIQDVPQTITKDQFEQLLQMSFTPDELHIIEHGPHDIYFSIVRDKNFLKNIVRDSDREFNASPEFSLWKWKDLVKNEKYDLAQFIRSDDFDSLTEDVEHYSISELDEQQIATLADKYSCLYVSKHYDWSCVVFFTDIPKSVGRDKFVQLIDITFTAQQLDWLRDQGNFNVLTLSPGDEDRFSNVDEIQVAQWKEWSSNIISVIDEEIHNERGDDFTIESSPSLVQWQTPKNSTEEFDEVQHQLRANVGEPWVRKALLKLGDEGQFIDSNRKGKVQYFSKEDTIGNADYEWDAIEDKSKKKRVYRAFKDGMAITMPTILANNNRYWLLGGNTRLTYGLQFGKVPAWVISV